MLRAEQLVEAMHDLGIMPDEEYLVCGDVTIKSRYNGPQGGLVIVNLKCVATDKFIDVFKLAGQERDPDA